MNKVLLCGMGMERSMSKTVLSRSNAELSIGGGGVGGHPSPPLPSSTPVDVVTWLLKFHLRKHDGNKRKFDLKINTDVI